VIAFNGEVYNYEEIRRDLVVDSSVRFRGHSDTEVLLAAFERWGIQAAVQKFTGMFAMAVWDATERELTLVRDRLGIKPLFIYAKNGLVLFGSELKALLAHPSFDRELDPQGLTEYFRYLYVPAPRTVFAHARKLTPATWVTLRNPSLPIPEPTTFWSLIDTAQQGSLNPLPLGPELVDELDSRLQQAVRLRMRSDVPVGALLSGGIDSSLVTALMQEQSNKTVQTFCIGFDEPQHDERTHAAAVARHLGTAHTEVRFTSEDALAGIPRVTGIFDEPFANPSNIPTLLICEAARREVTVALTGDGGDELFAGYNRYVYGRRVISSAQRWPLHIRGAIAALMGRLTAQQWDRGYERARRWLPGRSQRLVGEKMTKLAALLRQPDEAAMYRSLVSAWQWPEEVISGTGIRSDAIGVAFQTEFVGDLLSKMQLADQIGYLPDDLLAKVDRVSMAVSLEVRVPLLDHNVLEFAWRLPESAKIRGGSSKWLLNEVLRRRVPRALLDRPKMGFSVPLDQWLRGPLRTWAQDLLGSERLRDTAALEAGSIARTWKKFQDGRSELATQIWTVLMFEAWREKWG
jgi:asparagine synthase (glutamine-hydrolysing)